MSMNQGERIATLEEQVKNLARKVNHLETTISSMDSKLDALLALRYKGIGAFWLASTLIGTGIVGLGLQLLNWIRS